MITSTRLIDQPLRLALPPWEPPRANGVVAQVALEHLTRGWAELLLARRGGWLYVWTAAETGMEARALDILRRPGVVAATVAAADTDVRHLALALTVAGRLASERRSTGVEAAAGRCVTSWSKPCAPPGTVRVPHLVTVWHGTRATDSVVWEVLGPDAAARWLGTSDLSFVETHLDALVRLHERVRTQRLPATTAAMRLLALLGPARDLRTQFVLERPELFRALLAGSNDTYNC